LILRGMVEGKPNHEIATEMGFSVSAIRHETIRIYQALSVSDRKEAAKLAIMFSLAYPPNTLKPSIPTLPLPTP
jgi:DNA-binding NarL/FixJ family response regulator